MGRKLHYKEGSYYVADDRTGFPQRAEETKREWTGLRVDQNVWEARQPQDLVKGVPDYQAVPDPRPLGPNVYAGPVAVQTSAAAVVGQTVIPVQTIAGFNNGDPVAVMLDSGVLFNATLAAPPSSSGLTLSAGLPYTAASGNLVYDLADNPTNPFDEV